MTEAAERGRRKKKVGRVSSNRMEKTAVVVIENLKRHAFYPRVVRSTKKYKAHDEKNEVKIGDLVEITETKPISKDKRWMVTKVIEKAK